MAVGPSGGLRGVDRTAVRARVHFGPPVCMVAPVYFNGAHDMQWHDLLGSGGATMIVATYFLLQVNRLSSSGPVYSLLNALGAALILLSLSVDFNMPAFLIEFFWLCISLFGIGRWALSRRRAGR